MNIIEKVLKKAKNSKMHADNTAFKQQIQDLTGSFRGPDSVDQASQQELVIGEKATQHDYRSEDKSS